MQYPTAYKLERACFWMLTWHQLKWYFSKFRDALKFLALLSYVTRFIRLQIMFDKSIVKYLFTKVLVQVEETDEVAKKMFACSREEYEESPFKPLLHFVELF